MNELNKHISDYVKKYIVPLPQKKGYVETIKDFYKNYQITENDKAVFGDE